MADIFAKTSIRFSGQRKCITSVVQMEPPQVERWARRWPLLFLFVLLVSVQSHGVTGRRAGRAGETDPSLFTFTKDVYEVTIYENPPPQTYVSTTERMGIYLTNQAWDVKFKILKGEDREKFFKAEERTVGNFCFLRLRTRSGVRNVLNREAKEKYVLTVRAMVRSHSELQTQTKVIVTVLDTNDMNPLFYATDDKNIRLSEDTPLHQSIFQVQASDADKGINGDIYYSFKEWTETFAVHPTSGVITVTRPLSYDEENFYDLTVIATDQGPKHRMNDLSKPSTIKLKITITQVSLTYSL